MAKWRGECEAKGIKLTTEEVEYESITFRGAAKVASETYEILREMGIVLKSWKCMFKGVPMSPTVTFEPLKSGGGQAA
ncbi:hypothetical protein LTR78_000499 [Recurvomyces mirabilis]|uniref:Uncharacterized protein n=1 Tax=Recurvomyces mirabilis TaxID=574656 RepID=A0AAE0WXU9_9PEZI|nr:hypothetical protein LTR78_000499 [Recurvomyces mirabilis]KAK5162154.1 hypothetical protein LTS14_000500 [Recurvomyces mirabilis]